MAMQFQLGSSLHLLKPVAYSVTISRVSEIKNRSSQVSDAESSFFMEGTKETCL